jgi:hypothetical protein
MFDYDDAIGPGAAGSPFKASDDYPIKTSTALIIPAACPSASNRKPPPFRGLVSM